MQITCFYDEYIASAYMFHLAVQHKQTFPICYCPYFISVGVFLVTDSVTLVYV